MSNINDKSVPKKISDEQFADQVQLTLNQELSELDAATVSRLRQAREKALDVAREKRSPFFASIKLHLITAVAASVLVAVLVFQPLYKGLNETEMQLSLGEQIHEDEAFELLAAADTMDFYANLEFYEWLAVQENAG